MRIDAGSVVVFDLDDTLYREIDYLRSAYRAIARELDPEGWERLFARMFSMYRSEEDVFAYLSEVYETDKSRVLALYRNHKPSIAVFEGVIRVLREVKARGGKLGLISDGRSVTQRSKLEALAIHDRFDAILISEETGHEKPSPANYLAIERAFEGHRYCYVADNLRKDFVVPNRLGWFSVGVMDQGSNIHYDSYRYFSESHLPKAFVESIDDIEVV